MKTWEGFHFALQVYRYSRNSPLNQQNMKLYNDNWLHKVGWLCKIQIETERDTQMLYLSENSKIDILSNVDTFPNGGKW